jgi:hypothetical protein
MKKNWSLGVAQGPIRRRSGRCGESVARPAGGRTPGLVIAIPANEIVVPTILIACVGSGMLIQVEDLPALRTLLVDHHGWTLLTGCLMLFSVLHNPCLTTGDRLCRYLRGSTGDTIFVLMPMMGFGVRTSNRKGGTDGDE